jgi:hypothetical protein
MKKIILLVVLIMIAVMVWMYNYFGDIAGFEGDMNTPKTVQELNSFLASHEEENVVLSLHLNEKMRKQLLEGMKKSPTVLFTATDPNNPKKPTNYILKQLEGGKRLFIFDEKKGTLEGLFRTYKKQTSQGKSFTYLIPINPASIKQ